MPTRIGKHRQPGEASKFGFRLDNDVFNAVNQAAISSGRSVSAEVEHRLRIALELEPPDNTGSHDRETMQAATQGRLDAFARMLASAFVVGVMNEAALTRRPLTGALDDRAIVSEGLAALIKHVWLELSTDGDAIPDLRQHLLRRLPEF